MSEIRAFLQQMDDAWAHAWESLRSALDGITEEEAAWQADAYAAEEPEEGWPRPGTIAWQVAHVTHCKRYYREVMRSVGAEERPPVSPWTPLPDLVALRSAFEEAHRAERETLATFPEAALDADAGEGMTYREFIAMAIRHDTWHAAQIALARRLYRVSRPTQGEAQSR